MERLEPGKGYEGAKRERGYFDVETNGNGIFRDLPNKITVWHSHCDEVKELPDGSNALPLTKFVKSRRCSTRIDSCLSSVSSELFNEEFPAGKSVIDNFLALCLWFLEAPAVGFKNNSAFHSVPTPHGPKFRYC